MINIDSRQRLLQCIEEETPTLLDALQFYLARASLTNEQNAATAARELLNEVVVEALEHAQRFDPLRQPIAWLLGIAANLIKRKQAERARLNRHEPLARDLYPQLQELLSDDEIFDLFAAACENSPHNTEAAEQVSALLAHVSEADQQIIELAILYELDGEAVARTLNISAGAARVRLHRALNRLRAAYLEHKCLER